MNTNIAARILAEHHDFHGAEPLVDIEGLSSPRVCRLLNHLVAAMDPGEAYLEIGTWKGRTLLSAALGNVGRTCIGCDKFRLWGRFTGFGLLARRELSRNIERYRGKSADVIVHAMDSRRFFYAPERVPLPVGVYFYDGDHSYPGTFHGIVAAAPYLSDKSIVIVDDWNDPTIRRATFDAIREARLQILWERSLRGDHTERGFWNGLGVFFIAKRRTPAAYPGE